MPLRVLHALSQRPGRTGSGVTLRALTARAARDGDAQLALVGVPHDEEVDLNVDEVRPLRFGDPAADLAFPVPGMSDVMPYQSTVFSSMSAAQVDAYEAAWRDKLARALADFRPDVVHSHHAWLMSANLVELSEVPVVVHSHATGLRQLKLCPHLADRVLPRVTKAAVALALHEAHARELRALGFARVEVVGAGFDDAIFSPGPPSGRGQRVIFAGKLAHAKGLDLLLAAWTRVRAALPEAELEIAGGGGAPESEILAGLIERAPGATWLGRLTQPELAERLRAARVFALPSLYEGLPLSLVEAVACGCRAVATDLEGVRVLAPALGDALVRVDAPALAGVDVALERARAPFIASLARALEAALAAPPLEDAGARTAGLTWEAVYQRARALWTELAA